ncbi:unnamed protein product [Prorocentrum cordatum]|uniref:Uncharacterized protein n=1 Tax=Prorocentrum cordatum TaxID=2364126 RepID=A0ABN9U7T6_9DINO|nr:unnamed protein product [Polarella glacialis]|mmetsp:Transcript_63056/g.168738  ORF Transcript_63056/g.168738 Transcript_63056/m.168738 type:complete len:105 (-) Transcript_63056:332-646(-)
MQTRSDRFYVTMHGSNDIFCMKSIIVPKDNSTWPHPFCPTLDVFLDSFQRVVSVDVNHICKALHIFSSLPGCHSPKPCSFTKPRVQVHHLNIVCRFVNTRLSFV